MQDALYRCDALEAIRGQDDFNWLLDKTAEDKRDHTWRPTILAELGRLGDPDVIRDYARRLCEMKPSTKEAVAIIRQARIKRSKRKNYQALVRSILRAIDQYRQAREVEKDEVLMALREVCELIESIDGDVL